MAQITAALVKELREKTSAGMMDCKRALTENDGDVEASVDWLRTKGLAAAAKKSSRVAAEGLVGVAVDGTKGAVVEVNSETDFVALNEQFQGFVLTSAGLVLSNGSDIDALKSVAYPDAGHTVEEELTKLISTIGENMKLRRGAIVSVKTGVVVPYVHNAAAPGLGKIGVLVALESEGDAGALAALGKQIAMHVAATNPAALSEDDLDPELVAREKEVQIEKARESGKPENIIEKMIVGRMRKYYEEVCLLNQVFVIDGETRISKVLENAGKEMGADVAIVSYVRMELGAGIEKKEDDFAAEVKAAAGL